MTEAHPALIGYGNTFDKEFPLILVVGREPNSNEHGRSTGIGSYDFDEVTNCAFWNISYAVIASSIGLSAQSLKALCRERESSPIVYADASPFPVLNETRNKSAERLGVSTSDIAEHIAELFSYPSVQTRVKAVLLSGLGRDFARSIDMYRAHCEKLSVPVIEVPFFFGNNVPSIKASLPAHMDDIGNILTQFKATSLDQVRQ